MNLCYYLGSVWQHTGVCVRLPRGGSPRSLSRFPSGRRRSSGWPHKWTEPYMTHTPSTRWGCGHSAQAPVLHKHTELLKDGVAWERGSDLSLRLQRESLQKHGSLTVCVLDSGATPSLLMVSLKVYSTPASSSEPEIPSTGPLEPRPKFRVEQCSGPCKQIQNLR